MVHYRLIFEAHTRTHVHAHEEEQLSEMKNKMRCINNGEF